MRALALLLLLGCTAEKTVDPGPPRMEKPERDRGMALCTGYVTRLCRCAESDPSLREACDLAKGMPQGLELHIELLDGQKGALNTRERALTEQSARKAVAACVEADARLDPGKCAR
jgi:hypothetical protein